jgi:hypothetical protein
MEFTMFKMVTGDVVMGKVKDETEDTIVLTKPVQLMLDPVQGGVGMIPYDAVYSQVETEEETFEKKFIIHNIDIHSSFEEAYIKRTTGIETAPQEIIA